MSQIGTSLRIAAAAALLSATAFTSSMAAGDTIAQATPKAPPTDKSAAGRLTPDQAETKIKALHTKLKIKPEQEAQWKPVADTMRQNAQALDSAIMEREKAWKTMGVVDDLKSYERLSTAHAQGLSKLVQVFEPFYNSLSPEQKKLADAEFQDYRSRAYATQHPPANQGPGNKAINRESTNNPGAPVAGANSFTEGQAKARIEDKGFSGISDLKKDDKGVWRGTAMKNGQKVTVSVDFQGNVVAR